jgi:hypothetical protein
LFCRRISSLMFIANSLLGSGGTPLALVDRNRIACSQTLAALGLILVIVIILALLGRI